LLVSSLVWAALAELGLRHALGKRLAALYEEDPVCLYRLIPRTEKYVPRPNSDPGGHILIRINDDGFRGPALLPVGEARRILVFGDSCIHAPFMDVEFTFPVRLEKELEGRLPNRPFEVINAGVEGYGPDQIALRMERDLDRYHPELAIVALFADNDLGDLVRDRLFSLDDRGRLVRNQPTLDDQLHDQFRNAQGWALSKTVRKALNVLKEMVGRYARTGQDPIDVDLGLRLAEHRETARGDRIVHNLFEDGYDADAACDPDAESTRFKKALLAAVIGNMAETCRHARVPLAIVIIPSPADVCRNDPGYLGRRVDSARFPQYRPRALTEAMASAARIHDLPCLEFFDQFAATEDPAKLYYRNDNHWNAAGQALGARLTADFLLEQGLLSESPRFGGQ
jgi:hypothetical protein